MTLVGTNPGSTTLKRLQVGENLDKEQLETRDCRNVPAKNSSDA